MCKQNVPYVVKLVRNANGERLPVLLSRSTGLPDFDASLWVVASLRTRNLASESIAQALRSVVVLYLALQHCKVDLNERLKQGNFLLPNEIGQILKQCRRTLLSNATDLDRNNEVADKKLKKITKLEKFRMPQSSSQEQNKVNAYTTSIRLGYIREFLRWRINRSIAVGKVQYRENLITLRELVDSELKNNTPASTERAVLRQRSGIDRQEQKQLLEMLSPRSAFNPWRSHQIRVRNQLVVNAFLSLGIRRGELLGLRVGDFDPKAQEVRVLRRPDDVEDPRLHEPNTKTRDRILPVSYELHVLVKAYMIHRRELVMGRHDFLIVTNTGEPMSKSHLNRIFTTLQTNFLKKITPHCLRHSFFENIADDLYQAGKDDTEILNILTVLGGWSNTSNSPRRYTKRFAQERAHIAGLALQANIYINEKENSL
ncbi:site-specific integrase [Massilia oculi]|uniref:site-specific integrase n=1 Tax=Massilia oculi TaxID=945844 RepID=UPI001AAF2B1A|nr:site-specific integrase [Massilia oculi]